jgi:hypothetical protein
MPDPYAIKDAVSKTRTYQEKDKIKSPGDNSTTYTPPKPGEKGRDPNYEQNSRFANDNGWGGPATVGWSYSIDDAKKLAQSSAAAYAIYFCSEAAAKVRR